MMRSTGPWVTLAAFALALVLPPARPAGAANCLAGKNKCVAKKVKALLACHVTAEKHGTSISAPEGAPCVHRGRAKFDGNQLVPPDPSKGCFERLEARQDLADPPSTCRTEDDTDMLESKVDAFVDDVVRQLDPAYPAAVTNDCSAAKKKCVLKKTVALLKCHEKAAKSGLGDIGACDQAARDTFDGGADPSNGCFAHAEAKLAGCPTSNDTAALEGTVDDFVTDVLCELQDTTASCPGGPTPVPGPCMHQGDGTCGGDCGSPQSHCFLMVGGLCGCYPPTPTAHRTTTPTPHATVTSIRCDLALPPACAGGDCGGGFSSCQFMFGACVCEPPTPTPPPQPTPTPPT